LNGAHEPSRAWSGDGRINADFGQKTRDVRRRVNVELKWLGIGGCQPHELPAFPDVQPGADDVDDVSRNRFLSSDKIRAIEGVRLT
jgi:hypothetical protein